ncbi:MAG: hypothetical protein LBR55_04295 [Bacteroidales bacterium]|jgi:REP element-mobilizing transposase RayT|nr:hypothetical protein [Bacteroidales bacterium]
MSTEKFQNKYRIPSSRANWHDYGGGAYFVTVCTKNRLYYFGEIANNEMTLSPIGKFLHDNLQNITEHYQYAEIPLFVVMPNHFHCIVFIDGEKTPYERRNNILCNPATTVETRRATSLQQNAPKNEFMQNIANQQGWLSVTIGGIKSATTKFANENNLNFAWQTRFDDRIIRNQEEMNRIANYIENNIGLWANDCFNEINITGK